MKTDNQFSHDCPEQSCRIAIFKKKITYMISPKSVRYNSNAFLIFAVSCDETNFSV